MSHKTFDRGWLPLGNAKLIDWRFLDHDEVHEGAIAWADSIKGETVLARTWCEETITHLDFAWLAYLERRGHLTIQVSRPEPQQLLVKLQLSLGINHPSYSELLDFVEHSQTGLQGRASRTSHFDGNASPPPFAAPEPLSAAQIEILEHTPTSALHTEFGLWFRNFIEGIHEYFSSQPTAASTFDSLSASPSPLPSATPTKNESPTHTLPINNGRRPSPILINPKATPEPHRPSSPPTSGSRLFVATSSGESWEINDPETYIGRSKQCRVVLKSQRVSRRHASVTLEDGQWYLNDLGAANGVWAGQEKVEREPIEDGSEYIVGDVLLTFTVA